MYYLRDLEEYADEARSRIAELERRARERTEIEDLYADELQSESLVAGVRSRIASALISLGVKLDPDAAERLVTADEAA